MSLIEKFFSKPRRRPPLHCRLCQTYLPPSYIPSSCYAYFHTTPNYNDLYYYPQWAWSLLNTVFVSAATAVNTYIFVVGVFLWMLNRQFHFRKKHSYDKQPLQPMKHWNKVRNTISDMTRKNERKANNVILDDNKHKIDNSGNSKEDTAEKNNYTSFQSFLEDVDGDEAIGSIQSSSHDSRKEGKQLIEDKLGTKNNLLQAVSEIELFSYFSPEALLDVLSYVEYVDLSTANEGTTIFTNDNFDGSLYAVVSGEVMMSVSVHNITVQIDDSPCFSYVMGPGEIMTSMLSLITSVIREYHLQEARNTFPSTGFIRNELECVNVNSKGAEQNNRPVIPHGIEVHASVSSPNTRLIRIPIQCLINILKQFPKDFHQMSQAIVARLQRVTIQTLVRYLGLDFSLLGTVGMGSNLPLKNPSERNPSFSSGTSSMWKQVEQSLQANDVTSAYILDQATNAVASLFDLSQSDILLLKNTTSIVSIPPGAVVFRDGEVPGATFLIVKGSLEVALERNENHYVTFSTSEGKEEHAVAKRKKMVSTKILRHSETKIRNRNANHSFTARAGTFVGLFSCFTNDASVYTVYNSMTSSTLLLKIPAQTLDSIVSSSPRALIHCLVELIDTVGDGCNLHASPSMFLLDWTLDLIHVEAGEHIAIRGEPCDSMFVVLNGRLRAGSASDVTFKDGNTPLVDREEFGRGATIGALEALSEGRWTQSFYACRHCEVARVPMSLLHTLISLHPNAGIHFAKVLAKLQSRKRSSHYSTISAPSLMPSYAISIATIAVLPLSTEVDVSEFCASLSNSLRSIAPTKLLRKNEAIKRVGGDLLKHPNAISKVKMIRLLGDLEENNRLVVYEAEKKFTWWTKLCIQQADCVLLVVDSLSAPIASRVDDCLLWAHNVKNIRIELVVVNSQMRVDSSQKEGASNNLNNWSEKRPWISRHHLIRMPFSEHSKDFSRMCRRITGQSLGLVLGGGGARGLAHLGVIRALNEAMVPIDLVGGTSQGALVGALFARDPDDFEQLEKTLREMAVNMSSIKEKLLDLTFPLTSFFHGGRFNKSLQKILGDIRIQDLILNFYCVSVDIRNSCQVVHRKGLAWKYVRASMSLTGYLPPISENKSLLVDGGYMNIVPADVMFQFGAKRVIAVDVSYEKVQDYYEYGTELSGLWLLWNSWNPFVQTVKVPSMGDINERLSWVSSERLKKDVTENKVHLFLKPPVQDFGVLEFDKFDEIVKIGYDYAKPLVEQWAKENGYALNQKT